MKKLKIFALAASLLQAALFSAFAANPPSDFIYDLTDDNKAVKITGLRNDKAEYVIPASIEDFPVTDVVIRYDEKCNITLPEGCLNVSICIKYGRGEITVNQLPSTVKKLELGYCYYNGTLPAEIEDVSISGRGNRIQLNQDSSGLKSLKKLDVHGDNRHINFPYDLSELQNLESLKLEYVDVTNKAPLKLKSLKKLDLEYVNLIGNKTVYIKDANSDISGTNIEELIFEEGVTEIRDWCASNNKNLTKVVLPSTLKKIGEGAFAKGVLDGCPNLSEVVVPDSLGKIETNASKLEDVFDTTSLLLRNRAKLKEILVFSNK